jgi:hypothetical protein
MIKRLVSLALVWVTLFAFPLLNACAISELGHFSARISASPAVYSGPGKEYYRANNGKAQYGKGGMARIYGLASNGWMMIGYELGSGDYRIGYVDSKYAELLYDVKGGNSGIPQLNLDSVPATITRNCDLTDDPVIHTNPIAELNKGTAVTYLASLGKWAYIETDCSIGLTRAFVRKEYISTSGSTGGNPVKNPPSASWRSLYRRYLQANGSDEWGILRLIDLDFNKTPELLITVGRAHAGTIIRVLAIQKGKVVESEFVIMEMDGNSEWSYPADLLLFHNDASKKNEWLIFDGYIAMGGYESSMVNRLTFSNAKAKKTELFRQELITREQTNSISHTYFVDGQEVTKNKYNSRIEAFRSHIHPREFKAAVYDRMAGGISVMSAYDQIAKEYK